MSPLSSEQPSTSSPPTQTTRPTSDNDSPNKVVSCDYSVSTIKMIKEILPYINEKTLVVLDMDQTVIMDPAHIGNVHQPIINLSFVENDTKRVLDEIVKKNGKMVGLTARAYLSKVSDDAHDRMRELGFTLTCTWLDLTQYKNQNEHQNNFGQGFKKCIFYTAFQSKGITLSEILAELKKHAIPIDNIVFVDDTKNHCHNVNAAAKSANIPSCAFHYTHAVAN